VIEQRLDDRMRQLSRREILVGCVEIFVLDVCHLDICEKL
jgi:hypothetical protein